ncbi:uncharacterized protein LOC134787991, partial [Penaeus indicus]|uniref:uncharacterized protein LOC134787991 n=1 Tax=Penaeus indicus TaxID=29960 RepID=UPI00300C682C
MAKRAAAGWRWRAMAAALLLSSLLLLYYSKDASLTRAVDQEKSLESPTTAQRPSPARGNGRSSSSDFTLSERMGDSLQLSSSHNTVTDNIQAHDQLVTKEDSWIEKKHKEKHEAKFNKSILTKHRTSPAVDSETDVEKRLNFTSLSTRERESSISGDSSSVRNNSANISVVSSQTSHRGDLTSNITHHERSNNKKERLFLEESPQHGATSQQKVHTNKIRFISALNSFILADNLNFNALSAKRLLYMKTKCQALELPKRKERKTIRKKIAVRDLFSTCVAPKGGSTSWYELREKLKQHRFEGSAQAAILSVRHPLSRLTSAYSLKLHNGEHDPVGSLFKIVLYKRLHSELYSRSFHVRHQNVW